MVQANPPTTRQIRLTMLMTTRTSLSRRGVSGPVGRRGGGTFAHPRGATACLERIPEGDITPTGREQGGVCRLDGVPAWRVRTAWGTRGGCLGYLAGG